MACGTCFRQGSFLSVLKSLELFLRELIDLLKSKRSNFWKQTATKHPPLSSVSRVFLSPRPSSTLSKSGSLSRRTGHQSAQKNKLLWFS